MVSQDCQHQVKSVLLQKIVPDRATRVAAITTSQPLVAQSCPPMGRRDIRPPLVILILLTSAWVLADITEHPAALQRPGADGQGTCPLTSCTGRPQGASHWRSPCTCVYPALLPHLPPARHRTKQQMSFSLVLLVPVQSGLSCAHFTGWAVKAHRG